MILKSEIKDFIKKILILGIFISIFVNLCVTYFTSLGSKDIYGESNDTKFQRVDAPYLGTVGVALSVNVGTKKIESSSIPVSIYQEVMPISYILANKELARNKIITNNMISLSEYINIIKTDINSLLDSSSDRESMLESFLDQLKYRYTNGLSEIKILKEQAKELTQTLTSSDQKVITLKDSLTDAYKNLEYEKTQEILDEYLLEKEKNTFAKTYLVFIGKFIKSYEILNNYNKTLLDTIINNKEALIKNVTIVLPDSGNALLNNLNLIKTEAEFKDKN
ncbi:hypothetical protein KAZ01_00615 [Candidatus Gracilibacteria bacterium]|nr:hypothetical protein [Candidatus Gracilibacteria bacterium]